MHICIAESYILRIYHAHIMFVPVSSRAKCNSSSREWHQLETIAKIGPSMSRIHAFFRHIAGSMRIDKEMLGWNAPKMSERNVFDRTKCRWFAKPVIYAILMGKDTVPFLTTNHRPETDH